jgi:hypothetical protein
MVIPIAAVLTAVGGVSYLVEGRLAAGVFWLVAGLGLAALWLRRRPATRAGLGTVTPSLSVQFYGFFGAGLLFGIAMFGFAVVGLIREPVLWGVGGFGTAAANGYVIVRGTLNMRRLNRLKDARAE